MAWNKGKPADSDKIRLSAADIRGNFTAIEDETQTIPMTGLQLKEQGSDPTNEANKGFLYTKDDGAGGTQLFYMDESGNVIQLTRLTGLASNVIAYGTFTTAGADVGTPFNLNCSRASTGKYDFTFDNDPTSTPVVVATAWGSGTSGRYVDINPDKTYDTTGFSLFTKNDGGSPGFVDTKLNVIVVGGY